MTMINSVYEIKQYIYMQLMQVNRKTEGHKLRVKIRNNIANNRSTTKQV